MSCDVKVRQERPEFLRVPFCEVRLLAPDDRLHGPGHGEAQVLHQDIVVVVPVHVVNTKVHRLHGTRPLISQLPAHWLFIDQLSQIDQRNWCRHH